VPDDAVQVDLPAGTAVLEVDHLKETDFFTFENAILENGPQPNRAWVSFKVAWTASGPAADINNPAQRYRGEMSPATAQMEWSGRSGEFEFQSAPLLTSVSEGAQLGTESNGSFYS
jgi:hypothetical protein